MASSEDVERNSSGNTSNDTISRREFGKRVSSGVLCSAFPARANLWLPGEQTVYLGPDRIGYLMADLAHRSPSLRTKTDASRGWIKRFWVENWRDPSQYFEWSIDAEYAGDYEVTLMMSAPPESQVQVEGPYNSLVHTVRGASPEYSGFNWNRILLESPLKLRQGRSPIRIRLLKPLLASGTGAALKSIELLSSSARSAINARIAEFRSDTDWLNSAKFGFIVSFG